LQQGERLLKLGAYDRAIVALRTALAADPDNALIYERLRSAAIAGKYPDAAVDLSASLVELYARRGDMGAANTRLDELLALAPDDARGARLATLLGRDKVAPTQQTTWGDRLRSLLGIAVLLGAAYALSNNRARISLRVVLWGLGMQAVFALIILRTDLGHGLFDGARVAIEKVLSYTDAGASFLFGNLYGGIAATATSGPVMYTDGVSGDPKALGFVFAFHVLPTIIFFGALMSVLYHLGVIQLVVRGIAKVMQRAMGTSGAESLSAAGNIFVGQTEAPLLVRPYLRDMTRSELMAVMCGGFATVAGGVLAAYVRFGIDAGHLLAASVMSAPASLLVAKVIYPETEVSKTASGSPASFEKTTANVIDAATSGASDGMRLAVNVGAMVLAFIALIALVDGILGGVSGGNVSLRVLFGWIFYPLSWCMGVHTQDLLAFGNLLGTKLAVNEFVAYIELGNLHTTFTARSFTIATYALCGFANFSSIGIQIGGISGLAPERRGDLARIGLKAMLGGAIASWITACVAGILL
jgi:CNT family concentrative nucleoside transporter